MEAAKAEAAKEGEATVAVARAGVALGVAGETGVVVVRAEVAKAAVAGG